jgi:hypothetical protein
MVARIIVASAVLLLGASAYADLNLNPRRAERILDKMRFEQLIFNDGVKQITYSPPRGWTFSGSAEKFSLRPADKGQAEASIVRTALAAPYSLDDAGVKKLTESALTSVPGGSTAVTLISQEKNVFMLGGYESLLVKLSYSCYGENYNRSVLFLNRGKEQLRFQLSARDHDFQQLEEAFERSHLTWQNL